MQGKVITPKERYIKRKDSYVLFEKKLKETSNFFSALRIVTIAALIAACTVFYKLRKESLFLLSIIIFITVFGILVYVHNKIKGKRIKINNLIKINEDFLNRIEDNWKDFEDKGEEFLEKDHSYAGDLDVFGRGSIFQWLCCAGTPKGRAMLADTLSGKVKYSVEEIKKRQEAIKELSGLLYWRQRFLSEAFAIKQSEFKDTSEIVEWGKKKDPLFLKKSLFIFVNIMPVITLSLVVYGIITEGIFSNFVKIPLLIAAIILFLGLKKTNETLGTINKYKKNIKVYEKMLYMFSKRSFKSTYLKELQIQLKNENKDCIKALKKFYSIVSKVQDKGNLFYFPVNMIFLLDYRYSIALEKWKLEFGDNIEEWINVIGKIEELCSFAAVAYENSEWCMPEFTEGELIVKTEDMAHPLLGKKAVSNDLIIGQGKKIILITGSNMSGKSTLLRTVGVNLVLAYSGAPVRGKNFKCSIMDIYSCMRTGDNLEENISSFYAEILRIKKLMDAVKLEDRPIIFLLDEIFKGTNSKDRHTGAETLVSDLSGRNVIGLLSTHDLELCDMEQTNDKVVNYHFREYYKDNKIFFDYKLREGKSTTQNALYLMKMAGIDCVLSKE